MLTFIALGANLGDPVHSIETAVREVAQTPRIQVLRRASLFRSRPVGPVEQPDFVNSVLEAETDLDPLPLLEVLKTIEGGMGRTEGVRWGPRVIDLDILLYGSECIDEPRLTIPHREMHHRRFVLAPLAELAPDLVLPEHGVTVAECLAALADDPGGVVRLP